MTEVSSSNASPSQPFVAAEFEWLCQRYPFDVRSRSASLLDDFLERFSGSDPRTFVDLGSGFGANFIFLAAQLECPQIWYLVDRDAGLTQRVDWLVAHAHLFLDAQAAETFRRRLGDGSITYRAFPLDFANLHPLPTKTVDAFVANAVFDLNTPDQYAVLVENCLGFKGKDRPLSLYWTLHLTPLIELLPNSKHNEYFLSLFQDHMSRQQSFGRASGVECARMIAEEFKKQQISFRSATSDWRIDGQDTEFIKANFNFMRSATLEICPSGKHGDWQAWTEESQQRLANRELSFRIGHQDFLATVE